MNCLFFFDKADDDNEEIHFNKNTRQHQHRMYCMRNHGEAETESAADTTSHAEGTNMTRKSIIKNLQSLWSRTEGEQNASDGREREARDRDQHRFIEVTDPSLHYIVSQQHAKAITCDDNLIAETLKREAYRVARAHTRNAGTGSRRSEKESSQPQVFYEEGDTATHRSPINPLFYESRARSAKIDSVAAAAAVDKGKSNSRSRCRSSRSSGESYVTNDNSTSTGDRGDQGGGPLSAIQDVVMNSSSCPGSQDGEPSDRWHYGNTPS
jgi:hypothetical protein